MAFLRSVLVGVVAIATGASAFSGGAALPSLSRTVASSKCGVQMNAAVKLIPKIRKLGNSPTRVAPTKVHAPPPAPFPPRHPRRPALPAPSR